jgi:integrase
MNQNQVELFLDSIKSEDTMNQVKLFLESIKSDDTTKQYVFCLKKFFDFVGHEPQKDRKEIENKIIEYIIFLKKKGMSYCGISNYIVPIKSYYAINDVTLNVKKIVKFMPECKRARKDKSYEHKEISKMLEIADERMRTVILLLASTGMRIGAIPTLKIRNVDNTKITVYENAKEEYFTFITPECKNAIDSYIDMRSRYGEKLNDDSYLIREQFDVRCPAKPRQFKKEALQYKLYDLCKRCGIDKKDIAIAHGFRKFFTTQLINSKLNPEIREMLLGHKIGLASAYYRPTEEEMFQEYQKAINNLTIDPANRLKIEVELLKGEKNEITSLKKQVNRNEESNRILYSTFKDVLSLLRVANNNTGSDTKEILSIKNRLKQKGIRVTGDIIHEDLND